MKKHLKGCGCVAVKIALYELEETEDVKEVTCKKCLYIIAEDEKFALRGGEWVEQHHVYVTLEVTTGNR